MIGLEFRRIFSTKMPGLPLRGLTPLHFVIFPFILLYIYFNTSLRDFVLRGCRPKPEKYEADFLFIVILLLPHSNCNLPHGR